MKNLLKILVLVGVISFGLNVSAIEDVTKIVLNATQVTSNSAVIVASNSLSIGMYLEYGASQNFGSIAQYDPVPGFINSIRLTNLQPNTIYYYHLVWPGVACIVAPCPDAPAQAGPTYSFKTLSYNNQELVINKTLRYGMRDEQVKILQRFLGLKMDGSFGMLTKKAVMRFQSDRGLKADGIFGPKSIEQFYAPGGLGGGSTSARCTASNGTWSEQYKECTGIGADSCKAIGGTYNGCASACRHDPYAQMCTMNCVQVCTVE